PTGLFPREDRPGLLGMYGQRELVLSSIAQDLARYLREHGASFFADLVKGTQHLPSEVENGLWELVAGGVVTADGFDNLRALLDRRGRAGQGRARERRPRHSVGRWSVVRAVPPQTATHAALAP